MDRRNRIPLWAALACLMLAVDMAGAEQQSRWRTDKDGWVLRKKPGQSRYERFFAVGLWNIPGHTACAMENNPAGYRNDAAAYLAQTARYNAVYLPSGTQPVAGSRVEVAGSVDFYHALKDYQAGIAGISNGKDRDYQARQYTRKHSRDRAFVEAIDKAVGRVTDASHAGDRIWAPVDEIAGGGAGSGWGWPPEAGEQIYRRIKKKEPHTLVYTDLVGISRGNTQLFEQRYLQTHRDMPREVPYEALGQGARILPERPLLGFVQAYDGSPVYVNGTADYVDYDEATLHRFFYENLRATARLFSKSGDVMGINSFIDCNTWPALAGTAVDGIKAGAGKGKPVWLFFDGNGYARPAQQSATEFAKNLKCQIYIAVIHGATGIMFWNDRSLKPDVFNAIGPLVDEIERNAQSLFKTATLASGRQGTIHYIIKKTGNGKGTLIAANASTLAAAKAVIGQLELNMQPYEVTIKQL